MPHAGDYYQVTAGWTQARVLLVEHAPEDRPGGDVTETVNTYLAGGQRDAGA